jgi:predicted nucleic acid-binding Zn ribbon protein
MADVCDLSDGFNDLALDCARSQLRAIPKLPNSHGKCLNCESPVDPAQHFCSVECRDDFERIEAAKRRNGHR